eukprot:NODE_4304_length_676_cov_15.561404_g3664_i0.p2 GENE.NODE_4304_length_676_cov_15.561404_g3664_i0~~NODE_4304_length_676_cov_15.561404_g3664_i0.p2  ORF type:complete len:113 (-),score=18.83 NODE_4304_length_676_cov_15.561404_g3664_i0:168-506(-)
MAFGGAVVSHSKWSKGYPFTERKVLLKWSIGLVPEQFQILDAMVGDKSTVIVVSGCRGLLRVVVIESHGCHHYRLCPGKEAGGPAKRALTTAALHPAKRHYRRSSSCDHMEH